MVVPMTGLEPVSPHGQRILRLSGRLNYIPLSQRIKGMQRGRVTHHATRCGHHFHRPKKAFQASRSKAITASRSNAVPMICARASTRMTTLKIEFMREAYTRCQAYRPTTWMRAARLMLLAR